MPEAPATQELLKNCKKKLEMISFKELNEVRKVFQLCTP